MADISMQRKLRAIFSADVKGYSKLMGDDDEHTINTITKYRKFITELIEAHHGRVVDAPGDNILAEFSGALNAVNSAIEIQEELKSQNSKLPDDRRMDFRIGINLGDIVHREDRIYGDGVNVAARIESLADPGGICISRGVFDQVKQKARQGFEYLGEHSVKNISEPVRIYRVLLAPENEGKVIGEPLTGPTRHKKSMAVAITAILVCIAVILWVFYPRAPEIEPASVEKMAYSLPDEPSIAVIPFDNLSNDPDQDYFGDGISEQITASLSVVPKVFVIAPSSTFTFKNKALKVQQIAEELGVRYILKGSIQKDGQRVQITAKLIDAITGRHLWAERYDRVLKDIFALQDEITIRIITELRVKLTDGEQARLLYKGTKNLSSYLKYLQALEYFRLPTKENNALSRRMIEEVIEIEPDFPQAYTLLGATYWKDLYLNPSKSPKLLLKKAIELNKKAITLNDSIPTSYSHLGWLYALTGRHDDAIAQCERAISLDPNSADTHLWMGYALRYAGRHVEAVRSSERALRLNPIPSSGYFRSLGLTYIFVGKYNEAIEAFKKSLDRSPNDYLTHFSLACVYSLSERNEDAQAEAKKVLQINPNFSLKQFAKKLTYKNRADKELIIDAAKQAGLPDDQQVPFAEKPSIAVLPFENLSGDPDQQYFSDGFTEQIITSISKVPYISVIARQSSFAFQHSNKTVQQITKELGVRYILEGSLQRSGNQLRINAQLIDAASEHHIWADHYDREINDIFAVQDEICKNIMVSLQITLTEGEMARIPSETVKIKAYEKYLKAVDYYYRRTKEDSLISRGILQEALTIDPEYAAAFVLLGWTYLDDIWLGLTNTSNDSIAKAEKMVEKAILIHGVTAIENGLLSSIHMLKKNTEKSISYAEKAVEQQPSYANVHNILGIALRADGQYLEAISSFKRALQLDPINPNVARPSNLAWTYLYSKQYEKAISTWNQIIIRNPDYLFAYMGLTCAYWLTGSENQAKGAAKHVLRINPKFSVGYWEKRSNLKDKELREQIFDAWRKAGLQ